MKIEYQFLLLLMISMTGCKTTSSSVYDMGTSPELSYAEAHFAEGELVEAKHLTQDLIAANPRSLRAHELMSNILDQEVSLQNQSLEGRSARNLSHAESQAIVRTWIERSESYLRLRQYDQALFAAERVFTYDSDNIFASKLIDRINQEAVKNGQHESLIRKQMQREEADIRVDRYRKRALERVETGRWGEARLLIQKILLLSPEDSVALNLQEQIDSKMGANA